MTLNDSTREKIENLIQQNRVVLFMKGTPKAPQCGFSSKTVGLLDSVLDNYKSVDVLDDQDIREGIKVYGDWPTIPQLYIDGELVGGCDIITAMFNNCELHEMLGVEAPDRTPPEVTIADAAAEKILEAMEGHEGIGLHFAVDAVGSHNSTWHRQRDTNSRSKPTGLPCYSTWLPLNGPRAQSSTGLNRCRVPA